MFRILVAHLPCFRLERCGWESHQPVVLVTEERRTLRVAALTPAARKLGVRQGMALSEARALAPSIRTEPLDAESERTDLEALAEQLLKVSPSVSTLPPDALVAEIRGLEEGGERAVMEKVRIRLQHLGHQCRLAIADDPATALACATWGAHDQIVAPRTGASALAPLPLEALGLLHEELGLLQGLGVRTVGAFAALPPAAVAGRLGPIGVAAHALARGSRVSAPLPARAAEDSVGASRELPDPIEELDALLFVLNGLLGEAAATLAMQGKAAVRLLLRFRLEGAGEQELSVRLGEPTRDTRRLLATLRTRLERFQLAGPVTGLSVEVPEPVPFSGRQRGLMDWHSVGEALTDVMARLQDQLGEDAVRVPRLQSRHRPEAEWRATPFRPAVVASPQRRRSGGAAVALAAVALAEDPVAALEGYPAEILPDRPPILLPLPLAIEVEARPGQRPHKMQHDGRWHEIIHLEGPELLSGEWWDRSFQREYWRASLGDGRQAWLYREDGRWALHGWWDR